MKKNSERYDEKDRKPYIDIDYTNHGNSKLHPHVPHEHKYSNGIRLGEEEINK